MRRFLLMFAVVAAMVFTGCSDDEPKVTLNPLEEELAVMEGIISGSAMVVTNTSSGKEIGVFIKQ